MAVTSREIHKQRESRPHALIRMFGPFAYLVTFLLASLAIYVLVGAAVEWGQVRLDDLRYGRPRTTQLAGLVGRPGEGPARQTVFIGMNIERQVVVLELPA